MVAYINYRNRLNKLIRAVKPNYCNDKFENVNKDRKPIGKHKKVKYTSQMDYLGIGYRNKYKPTQDPVNPGVESSASWL